MGKNQRYKANDVFKALGLSQAVITQFQQLTGGDFSLQADSIALLRDSGMDNIKSKLMEQYGIGLGEVLASYFPSISEIQSDLHVQQYKQVMKLLEPYISSEICGFLLTLPERGEPKIDDLSYASYSSPLFIIDLLGSLQEIFDISKRVTSYMQSGIELKVSEGQVVMHSSNLEKLKGFAVLLWDLMVFDQVRFKAKSEVGGYSRLGSRYLELQQDIKDSGDFIFLGDKLTYLLDKQSSDTIHLLSSPKTVLLSANKEPCGAIRFKLPLFDTNKILGYCTLS